MLLVEAAADEVGEVLHATTGADVLEVHRSHGGAVVGEAEVRQLGVTMYDGLVRARAQSPVELTGGVLQRPWCERSKLLRAGRQVPVRPDGPEPIALLAKEPPVEVGQPGQARWLYSDEGQLLNTSLADYLVPMASEMPDIHVAHIETPTKSSVLGAKGAGEAGTGGAPAAVMNAVNDALRHMGVTIYQMPMTPDRILSALAETTADN